MTPLCDTTVFIRIKYICLIIKIVFKTLLNNIIPATFIGFSYIIYERDFYHLLILLMIHQLVM